MTGGYGRGKCYAHLRTRWRDIRGACSTSESRAADAEPQMLRRCLSGHEPTPVDVDGKIRVTQAGSRDRRSARVATAATHCGQPHRRRPVIDRVLELHRIQGAEFPSSRPKHTRHRLKVLHSARLPDLLLISHRCDGAAVNRGRAARQRDTVRVRGSLSLLLASSAPVLEISKWCGSEDLLP